MLIRKFILVIVTSVMMMLTAFSQNGIQLKDTISDANGNLRYFTLDATASVKTTSDAVAILKSIFVQNEGNTGFRLIKTKTQRVNQKSILYQQMYKNVPVYDGYYYLHFKNDIFTSANGEFNVIKSTGNAIQLNEATAINIAVSNSSVNRASIPSSTKAELVLWKKNDGDEYRYVYQVEVVYPDALQSKQIMVDAATGTILISVPMVCNLNVPCTGSTLYSSNRNFTGDSFGGGLRLREIRRGVNISTLNNQNNIITNAVDFVNPTTAWTSAGANAGALDVHLGTELFLDYFSNTFIRNSIDNNGHSITCYTNRWEQVAPNVTKPMDNAYFDPATITFSFGNGLSAFNSVTSLDVVAHELGHGFAYYEVDFNNTGEARSLNEGFSDIWGVTIENWSAIGGVKQTWTLGEEIMANGFSCLRSLRNPTGEGWRKSFLTEGNYPDTRFDSNWDINNDDPHVNATVLGHWYYLLSQGGSGTNGIGNPFKVTGLGITTAAQIAYNTEMSLTPSSDFTSVRVASIAYASQEWGANSCEVKSVTDAWFAVGVGDAFPSNYGLSITGDSKVCTTSSDYTIPNLPTGANVTWTADPPGIITINTPGLPQTTVTKNNNGIITLKATIKNLCGDDNIIIYKDEIAVGYPKIMNIGYPSSTIVPNELIPMQIFIAPDSLVIGNQKLVITRMGGGYNNTLYTGGDGAVEFSFPTTGTYNIKVYTYNECGWSTNFYPLVFFCTNEEMFMLSPNPAHTELMVKLNDEKNQANNEKNTNTGIREIQLTDKMGNVLKRYVYSGASKQVTIDVSTLKSDFYYVRVLIGKQWAGKSFMKQ